MNYIQSEDSFFYSSTEYQTIYANNDPEWVEMRDRLHNIAFGEVEALSKGDDYIKLLLQVGTLMNGPVLNIQGATNNSHTNVADLLDSHEQLQENVFQTLEDIPVKALHLATGYVYFQAEQTWRQHSWLLSGNSIIETCFVGDKYFGVILVGNDRSFFRNCHASTKAYHFSLEARFFNSDNKPFDYRSDFVKFRDGEK